MKIALKNFITTLKRYRTASALNIVGLTLAFMAFYIIMAQVVYNVSYNRSIEDSERIYLITTQWSGDEWSSYSPRYTTEQAFKLCPDVEYGGSWRPEQAKRVYKRYNSYHFEPFDGGCCVISPSMFDVLSFKSVEGNLHDISKPDHVVISQSLAKRMDVSVGDVIYLPSMAWNATPEPEKPVTIAGIYKDFAPNTMMKGFDVVMYAGDDIASIKDNGMYDRMHFVKLREGADPQSYENIWKDDLAVFFKEQWQEEYNRDQMRLVSLNDTFFSEISSIERGTVTATVSLAAVAILVVLIAFINFVNFFFALIPIRIRTVNISKVFGAATSTLRWSFIFEAVALVTISLALALYLMIAIKESFIKNYVTCSLALGDNLLTIGVILVIVVVLAFTASLYPSYYITSFAASLGVKGGFAGSLKGRRLRMVLATAQFAISITLIIVTTAIWLQYRYLVNADIGFNIDNVLLVKPSNNIAERYDAFMTHLEKNPNVEGVTAIDSRIGQTSFQSFNKEDGTTIRNYVVDVHHNFPKVMGIDILEGDGFKPELEKRQYLLTKRAHQAMVADDGETVRYRDEVSVVGVCENVELMSLADKNVAGNYMILVYDNYLERFKKYNFTKSYAFFLVRVAPNANIEQMKEFIRESVQEFDPGAEEPTIRFFRDDFEQLYVQTRRQAVLLSIFAVLSVIISLMGVFGIVLFEMQHRRHEIAIRRVFGATTSGMLWMLNSRYAKIVVACFVVAAPVAWYIVGEWQKDFAQQAPIGWWVYLLALLLVLGITLGLVTQRSWRAANENPARVIKGE